jgi:hypothetical protein
MRQPGIVWAELPYQDVLAHLQRTAGGSGAPGASGFLDTHQWAPGLRDARCQLNGGHPAAQFRRLSLGAAPPVRCFALERTALPEGVRTARQLRAWLYRNGLPDGAVGDIVIGEYTMLAVEEDIELLELGLQAQLVAAWDPPAVPVTRVTAAGPRADAVTAAVFKLSRGEAQTAIRYGFVFCDFAPVAKQTQACPPGAQLVFRTKGRVELVSLSENTKSGRLWVEYRAYPA